MKTSFLLLTAGGVAVAGTLAMAGPRPAAPDAGTAMQRTGSGDGAGWPGAPGGRAGAPGRVGGWSAAGGRSGPKGLRSYCAGLLDTDRSRPRTGGFRPSDCVGLFAAMARPNLPGDEDDVPEPGSALSRACATLLKPGARPLAGEPEACSDYVASLDTDAPRREAGGAGSGGRAPDGPSIAGGIGGRGGRAGAGPGGGAGGAGGAGVGGGLGGAGGPGGAAR
ncbi:translational initiation factor [Methylobacterium terricola]|uniref:translational initiation factor n=1 Tax=Methylobacterium terricola TaxID=2583531 RepID=UPI001486EAD3|nr:translational initiation factor [Methylobacterium terricola]